MLRPLGMRLRIAMSVTGMVLLLILAQAIALILVHEEMEIEFIDDLLAEQLEYSIQASKELGSLALPNTPNMHLFRLAPGVSLPDDMPLEWSLLPVGNHEVRLEGREFHLAIRDVEGVRFILSYDESGREAQEQAINLLIMAGALMLCVLVLVMVYLIVGRLTSGLEKLAVQVESGRGGTYVQPDMEREVRAVAEALDRAEQRQMDLLAREQGFNAHLSHELRTPLSAIRTDAELMLSREGVPDPVRYRAERIVATADQIMYLAESLLFLAREATPQLQETVLLQAVLTDIWAVLVRGLEPAPVLTLEMSATLRLRADPALLQLVLRNLLDNALRHGQGKGVVVSVQDSRLTVRDQGPGLPPGEEGRIFERFYRAGHQGGHGLGLALVQHVCNACGWIIQARNHPLGGTLIEIDFGGDLSD